MSTFVPYFNEVLVPTPVGTGEWVTLDLAPFLADPTAKAVVLRVARSSGAGAPLIGFRGINEIIGYSVPHAGARYSTTIVSLAGGTTIEMQVTETAFAFVWITGEVHEHVGIHDQAIRLVTQSAEFSTYVDRQPTPQGGDALGDIAAVIVRAIVNGEAFSNFIIRERGSSQLPTEAKLQNGSFWYVVGVNENGYYQTNTDGKTGFELPFTQFFEVGYILKSSQVVTVLDTQEEQVPAANSPNWDPLDLSLTNQPIDEGAIVVGIEWWDTTRSWPKFIKAVGSDDVTKRWVEGSSPQTQIAQVNDLRQVEYSARDAGARFWIWWWENAAVSAPTITNTPAAAAPAGVDYAEQMTATGTTPLTWELTEAPPGATIGSSTGLIAWVPLAAKVGTVYDFTAVVTGPGDDTDTLSWQVTVGEPQLTARIEVVPNLDARTETDPTQTLASVIEPALGADTKVEIS